MIFDSKRRQTAEREAEATTLEDPPRDTRAIAPDDMQPSPATATRQSMRQESYPMDEPGIDRPARQADDGIESRPGAPRSDADDLEPLFRTEVAQDFRRGWDAVQIGFVDDPRKAVHDADVLVNRVLDSLSETFKGERGRLEAQVTRADATSTEDLRVALRRYRSFLHRLLSL